MAEVSVVVVTFESQATIAACLASLPPDLETVVVDNGSLDETVAIVRERFPHVAVIEGDVNRGFGAGCNLGVARTSGERVLLLNPDAAVTPGAIAALQAALAADRRLGAVGPLIRNPDGTPELSWGADPDLVSEWRRAREQHGRSPRPAPPQALSRVDWVSGACMLIRREAWAAVGGFDEDFFLYFEDCDLCLRLRRAGWGVAIAPDAEVNHVRGASAGRVEGQVKQWYRESQDRYYAKHRSPLETWLLRRYVRLRHAEVQESSP